MIPEYSKGISQPPKLTIFAPRRRWTEFRAVLRNSTVADVFTEGFSFARRNIERSMRVLECQGRRPPVIFAAPARPSSEATFAEQGIAQRKALVAASRMSYYELSETDAYSTQRRRRCLHFVRNVTNRNRSAPARSSAVSANRNTISGWRWMECIIVQTAARPATSAWPTPNSTNP